MASHGEHAESLKDININSIIRVSETLTVSCFLETVIGIVVRGVDVYRMSKFLQPESSIDHKAFGATCQNVWQTLFGDFTTKTHRFRGLDAETQRVVVVRT